MAYTMLESQLIKVAGKYLQPGSGNCRDIDPNCICCEGIVVLRLGECRFGPETKQFWPQSLTVSIRSVLTSTTGKPRFRASSANAAVRSSLPLEAPSQTSAAMTGSWNC